MKFRLIKIDNVGEVPYYLRDADICFYWREYASGKDYRYAGQHSEFSNQLIKNLQILCNAPPNRKRHKESAIKQIAEEFIQVVSPKIIHACTFVPIPTSKSKDGLLYDNRLLQILKAVKETCPELDIKELLLQQKSTNSNKHNSSQGQPRQTIDELLALYTIDETLLEATRDNIIIFDDVISSGRHYVAGKQKLESVFSEKHIFGLFVARTINPTTVST